MVKVYLFDPANMDKFAAIMSRHEAQVPASITSAFAKRVDRDKAVATWTKRKGTVTDLFPTG